MTLIQAIMQRDDCSYEEAIDLVKDMAEQVSDGADPVEVLFDEGFEPDYILDLLENIYSRLQKFYLQLLF